jgi:DNA repair protein RadD
MTFELRQYQRDAVDGLYQYWADGKGENPLIIAPTGAGKTAIIAQIVRDAMSFPDTRVLILSHVKELLEQGAAGLMRMYPDADFGFYSASIGQKRLDKPITFAGIQSIYQRAFDMIPAPDLVLIDEAHMVPKNTETRYGKFLADLKTCNPRIKVVGLTATPFRLDSGMLHEGAGALFDGIAYDIPVGFLMDQGYLSPVISKGGLQQIDLTNVKKIGGEFSEHDLAVAASDPALVAATVKEIATLGADRKSWLLFASGVDHADMLADGIRDLGHTAEVVTGEDGAKDRAQKIDAFKKGHVRCLVNCNVLTTGFDAPSVDLVALVRATMSAGLYIQMVGRGTRLHEGKENCLILDYGQNVQRHGFIDKIKPKRKGAGGEGEAPAKQCPECQEMLPTATRMCVCGYEFPPPALNHAATSYGGAMLSTQVQAEWLDVDHVTYQRWEGREGKRDTLRVTYHCGLSRISEWLCPDHGGFAASKYVARLAALQGTALTLDDAIGECADWVKPSRIKVLPDGKFHKIMQLDYKPKEVDHAAQKEAQRTQELAAEMFGYSECPF